MTEIRDKLLATALLAAQSEMPSLVADGTADIQKDGRRLYSTQYVTLDRLIAVTRPVLNRHGLVITQAPEIAEGKPALRTTIIHESGEYFTAIMPLILARNDMQGLGAAITYARRYAWAAALGVAGDVDDDGVTASAAPRPAAEAEERKPQRAPREARSGSAPSRGRAPAIPITEAQGRLVYARAKAAGIEQDDLRVLINDVTGKSSTDEILRSELDAVLEAIADWDEPTGYSDDGDPFEGE